MTRVWLLLGDNPSFHHLELLNFVWNKEPPCVQKKKGTSAGNSLTNSRTNVWLFFFFECAYACMRVCVCGSFSCRQRVLVFPLYSIFFFIFLITTLKSSPVGTPLSLLLSPPPLLLLFLTPSPPPRWIFLCIGDILEFLERLFDVWLVYFWMESCSFREIGVTHTDREKKKGREKERQKEEITFCESGLWMTAQVLWEQMCQRDVSGWRVSAFLFSEVACDPNISHRRWWRFLSVFFFVFFCLMFLFLFCLFDVFATKQKTFPGDFDCETLRQICTKGGTGGDGVTEKKNPSWSGDKSKVLWCQNGKNVSPAETIKHTPLL